MGNDDPIQEPHDTDDPQRYLVGWMFLLPLFLQPISPCIHITINSAFVNHILNETAILCLPTASLIKSKLEKILQVELPEDILSSLCDREYTLLTVDDALGKSGAA